MTQDHLTAERQKHYMAKQNTETQLLVIMFLFNISAVTQVADRRHALDNILIAVCEYFQFNMTLWKTVQL